jgi:hypothetical protein
MHRMHGESPVREDDIFVPLDCHDQSRVEPEILKPLPTRLLEHFDGLTFFPQPNEGDWRVGGLTLPARRYLL